MPLFVIPRRWRARLSAGLSALAGLAALTLAAAPAQASTSGVVISQVYGGSSASGYQRDFVEIYNAGSASVDITGWSIQKSSATGTGLFSTQGISTLSGVLQPGQYTLVALGATIAGGAALPAPFINGSASSDISSSAGKVVLVNNSTGLACNGGTTACSAAQLAQIVDLVGFGSATFFEGSAAPTLTSSTALFRQAGGCSDTDNNSADFSTSTPAPRTSASPLAPCGGGGGTGLITPSCPALTVLQGSAGSVALTASDSDGLVNSASISSGATSGITLGTLTAAGSNGASASITLSAASTLAVGSYPIGIQWGNNQAQSASCTVNVTVQAPGAVTRIFNIQGSGATSPLVGQTVTTQGVVTGVFPGLRGYYIQDETGDGNAATSDGLFVFNNNTNVTATVGQKIQVTGTITEYTPSGSTLSITELTAPTGLVVIGTGSITPTAVTLPEATDGELERVEGMLVRITSPLTVSQNYFLGRYGQVTLSAQGRLVKPTQVARPGTAAALAIADANARRRIVLDDGQSSEALFSGVENPNPIPYIGADNTLRAGDTVTDLTGVIDMGRVTATTGTGAIVDMKIHPTVAPSFVRAHPRTATAPSVGGALKVASFNVLNYFTTFTNGATAAGGSGAGCLPSNTTADCRGADTVAEFTRQRNKIISALLALNADVVGLMEIQRNGDVAPQNLIDGLNAIAGAGTWAFVPDPATGVGTDAIRVAMIYKPARVSRVGASLSDTNPIHNRAPVAQTFQSVANGEKFTVLVNHFKSKSCSSAAGADADLGDGQGCYNDRRKQQATALLSYINTLKTSTGDPDVMVIGDLNAYGQEDPIDILVQGGLVNQTLRFAATPEANYSYVFDGEVGTLDVGLATATLSAQIVGATHWHINADEPSIIDYNTEFKPQDLYSATPYRASDHDPVLIGLQLGAPLQSQSIAFAALANRAFGSGSFSLAATASSGLAVSYSSLSPLVCSVSGNSVSLLDVGACAIAANQAGNASFAPASEALQTFSITLGAQTINFPALPARSLSQGPFMPGATASSGLVVVFSITTPSVCTVDAGGVVTPLAAGTCSLIAVQTGNTQYASATAVTQSFVVQAAVAHDADVPLPLWAVGLAAALMGRSALRRRHGRQAA
ncbi:MAG: hypothetical protein RJA98_697 [Pseudomonadota bacterium]|jgi:predicted extracellular nuclease